MTNIVKTMEIELDKVFAGASQSSNIPCVICGSENKKPAYFYRNRYNIPKYFCLRCEHSEDAVKFIKRYNSRYNPFKQIIVENIENRKIIDLAEYSKITNIPNEATKAYLAKRNFTNTHIQSMFIRSVKKGDIIFDKKLMFNGLIIPTIYKGNVISAYIRSYESKNVLKFSNNVSFQTYWNYENLDATKPVFVFESIFDAVSSGIKNVTSINGINFKNAHFSRFERVILCFDNYNYDEASKTAISKYKAKNVRIFNWGSLPYKDFNEWLNVAPAIEIFKYVTNNIIQQNNYLLSTKKKENCY